MMVSSLGKGRWRYGHRVKGGIMKNKTQYSKIGLLLLIAAVAAIGVAPAHILGGDAFNGTDIGTSARMIGIGNIEGFSTTAESIFENPAALYRVEYVSASLFTTRIIDEIQFNQLSLAFKSDFGTIGLGYFEAGVDGIPVTDLISLKGMTEFKSRIAKVAFVRPIQKHWYMGVSLVYYSTEFSDFLKGTGYNVDVGFVAAYPDIEASLSFKNVVPGSELDYEDGTQENLPFQVVFSTQSHLNDFKFFGQVKGMKDRDLLLAAGLSYSPAFLSLVSVSAGHKQFFVADSMNSTMSLGLTLALGGVFFDYAYEKSEHPEFDNNNHFSVRMNL